MKKLILLFLFIPSFLFATQIRNWDMTTDTSTGTVIDTLNGDNLTATGGVTRVTGKFTGNACNLPVGAGCAGSNRVNNLHTASEASFLNGLNTFTIIFWLYYKQYDSQAFCEGQELFDNYNGSARSLEANINTNGTNLYISLTDSSNNNPNFNGAIGYTLSFNTWYQIAITYDKAEKLHGYINGIEVGNANANNLAPKSITGVNYFLSNFNTQYGATGIADKIRVYNTKLSSTDILTDYNGVLPDTTPPTAPPYVYDGTGADISSTTATSQLSANWGYSTASSSVSAYYFSIGTVANGTSIVSPVNIGNGVSTTTYNLSLIIGTTYYFNVYALATNGITGSTTSSNGQYTWDTVPSSPAFIRDGTGVEISISSTITRKSFNWGSASAASGIASYTIAIGSTVGGTDTINWTNIGNNLSTTTYGLNLNVRTTYYFSVAGISKFSLSGTTGTSSGQYIQSGIPIDYPGLLDLWHFDEGIGTMTLESVTHTYGDLPNDSWTTNSKNGSPAVQISNINVYKHDDGLERGFWQDHLNFKYGDANQAWSIVMWIYDETSTGTITPTYYMPFKVLGCFGNLTGLNAYLWGSVNPGTGAQLDNTDAWWISNDAVFDTVGDTGSYTTSGVSRNNWHMITFTYSVNSLILGSSFYVCVDKSSSPASIRSNPANKYAVALIDGTTYFSVDGPLRNDFFMCDWVWWFIGACVYYGELDESAIFDHELTTAERVKIYNYDNTVQSQPSSNVVVPNLYYRKHIGLRWQDGR